MPRHRATKAGPVFYTPKEEAAANTTEATNRVMALKNKCEQAILDHIQAQVNSYNEANQLSLTDAYRCEQYSRTPGYSHAAFCSAVWTWNVEVWEAARGILAQAQAGEITITRPADVIALLPAFEFGVK